MSDIVDGLDDDDIDTLLDRLADRADQRDDLQLPGGGASRRGVLAALLGAGGIGAAASQAAAIGESESYGSATGVAGTDSEPLSEANIEDAHVQDLVVDSLGRVEDLEPKRLAGGYVYAGAFDGDTPDARLDNALAAANDGERIQLENAVYSGRTVTKAVGLYGTRGRFAGAELSGTLTLNASVSVGDISLGGNNIVHDGGFAEIERVRFGDIQINEDNVTVHNGSQIDVTVASSSSASIVDNLSDGSTVTDNGSGTIVGDVK